MRSTHLESAEARGRGTGKSGALCGSVSVAGGGAEAWAFQSLSQFQEPLRRCRAHPRHETTSLLLGVGPGAAS